MICFLFAEKRNMRDIKLFIACSLDGYIAGPNEEIDWLFTDDDYGYSQFYASIDTTLNGYKTYEKVLSFEEFPYKGTKNYVFTRHPDRPENQYIEYVREDIVGFIRTLKQQPGKDIWLVGGGEIISILHNHHLIDEYIIAIHPIILGDGIPLFGGQNIRQGLQVTDCKSYTSGLIQIFYRTK
jgi:dihydrofolate reductase